MMVMSRSRTVSFREMRIEDIDQMMVVEHESFTVPWSKEAFYNELTKNEFALYTVLEVEGQVSWILWGMDCHR